MLTLSPAQSPVSSLINHDALEHQLLSMWIDAAHVGLCVIDDTGRVVMLNPGACRKFGVDGTEVLNRPLKALLVNVETSFNLAQSLATPGFDAELEITVNSVDGPRYLLLKSHSMRTEHGERYKVVAITDVTQLTQALRDSEQHRRQWQAANAGVVLMDARADNMPITYVNPVFERMTGYTSAEALGQNCRFLQGTDTNQPATADIRAAIENQTNGYALLRNYRKDGSMFLNELFIAPVRDEKNAVTHFIGIQHLRAEGLTDNKMA